MSEGGSSRLGSCRSAVAHSQIVAIFSAFPKDRSFAGDVRRQLCAKFVHRLLIWRQLLPDVRWTKRPCTQCDDLPYQDWSGAPALGDGKLMQNAAPISLGKSTASPP